MTFGFADDGAHVAGVADGIQREAQTVGNVRSGPFQGRFAHYREHGGRGAELAHLFHGLLPFLFHAADPHHLERGLQRLADHLLAFDDEEAQGVAEFLLAERTNLLYLGIGQHMQYKFTFFSIYL